MGRKSRRYKDLSAEEQKNRKANRKSSKAAGRKAVGRKTALYIQKGKAALHIQKGKAALHIQKGKAALHIQKALTPKQVADRNRIKARLKSLLPPQKEVNLHNELIDKIGISFSAFKVLFRVSLKQYIHQYYVAKEAEVYEKSESDKPNVSRLTETGTKPGDLKNIVISTVRPDQKSRGSVKNFSVTATLDGSRPRITSKKMNGSRPRISAIKMRSPPTAGPREDLVRISLHPSIAPRQPKRAYTHSQIHVIPSRIHTQPGQMLQNLPRHPAGPPRMPLQSQRFSTGPTGPRIHFSNLPTGPYIPATNTPNIPTGPYVPATKTPNIPTGPYVPATKTPYIPAGPYVAPINPPNRKLQVNNRNWVSTNVRGPVVSGVKPVETPRVTKVTLNTEKIRKVPDEKVEDLLYREEKQIEFLNELKRKHDKLAGVNVNVGDREVDGSRVVRSDTSFDGTESRFEVEVNLGSENVGTLNGYDNVSRSSNGRTRPGPVSDRPGLDNNRYNNDNIDERSSLGALKRDRDISNGHNAGRSTGTFDHRRDSREERRNEIPRSDRSSDRRSDRSSDRRSERSSDGRSDRSSDRNTWSSRQIRDGQRRDDDFYGGSAVRLDHTEAKRSQSGGRSRSRSPRRHRSRSLSPDRSRGSNYGEVVAAGEAQTNGSVLRRGRSIYDIIDVEEHSHRDSNIDDSIDISRDRMDRSTVDVRGSEVGSDIKLVRDQIREEMRREILEELLGKKRERVNTSNKKKLDVDRRARTPSPDWNDEIPRTYADAWEEGGNEREVVSLKKVYMGRSRSPNETYNTKKLNTNGQNKIDEKKFGVERRYGDYRDTETRASGQVELGMNPLDFVRTVRF